MKTAAFSTHYEPQATSSPFTPLEFYSRGSISNSTWPSLLIQLPEPIILNAFSQWICSFEAIYFMRLHVNGWMM